MIMQLWRIGLLSLVAAMDESVIVLTDKTFNLALQDNPLLLVEFYAPWCGHCKQLAPEYEKAAKVLKAASPPVEVAKIDATVYTSIAETYGVQGFPTLKLFINGNAIDYTGGRTDSSIVTWVMKRTGPVATELKSLEQYEAVASPAVIACMGAGREFTVYEAVAREVDVAFYHTINPTVCQKIGAAPSIEMIGPAGRATFDQALSHETLSQFVRTHRLPVVIPFDGTVAPELFGDGRPLLFLFRAKGDTSKDEIFHSVATEFRGKIVASVSGANEPMEQRLMDYVGVDDAELPTVRIVTDPTQSIKKYKLEDVTQANLSEFVTSFFAGTLRPHLKSEPVVAQTGPVVQLVGTTFKQTVMDESKDVLVQFYASWCGHCKKFETTYVELATKLLSSHPHITVSRMDATLNDVEGVSVSGFPSIRLYAQGKKDRPLEYDGERDVKSLVQWLDQHTTMPLEHGQEL